MNDRLVLRDVPYGIWFFEAVFILAGIFFLRLPTFPALVAILMIGGCLVGFGFTSILTIIIERQSGHLTLDFKSPLKRTSRAIQLDQIAGVRVTLSGYSKQLRGHRSGPSYTLVADMKDGTVVPFRSYGSGGFFGKLQMAESICSFLGLPAPETTRPYAGVIRNGSAIPQSAVFQQSGITGPAIAHETDGVHWHMQTALDGNIGVGRWTSQDFAVPGGFLYLAQKPPQSAGGMFSTFNRMFAQGSMMMYGFTSQDTPGMDSAGPLLLEAEGLETCFSTFASAPEARQLITPRTAQALAAWADRHTLHAINAVSNAQLAVLFGPGGISLSMSKKIDSAVVEELTVLGVELVKAQLERIGAVAPNPAEKRDEVPV